MIRYLKISFRFLLFLPFYAKEIIRSNFRVIRDVVTAKDYARPAILRMPLGLEKPGEIFLLANLITMTPGTICLDISPDKKHLFVHVMFHEGDSFLQEYLDLEQRVGGLFK